MAASDAKPIPRKNVAHRVYFPILDADGDPVADGTGLLGLVSTDAASFVTTASAPSQVSVSSGVYFCDLSASEMNGDGVVLKVTSSSAGAKATVIVMYPADDSDIRVNVREWANAPVVSVGVAGTPKVDVSHWLSTAAATPTVAGVPEVDVTHWIGTAAATPTVAGVPEVDLTHVAGSTTNVAALATNVDAILTDTAEIGAAGAGLTAIDLPDQTMNITGNITGNLSGSVGSVTAKVSANVIEWLSSPLVSVGVAGTPKVDVSHWLSTAAATPTVAGVPEVDVTHFGGGAGTFASGVPAVNTTQISGAAGPADRLERSTTAIVLGTVGTSSTTTAVKFSSLDPASVVNSQFVGRIITFDAATTTTALRGQATDITAWDHATLVATVTALTTAPASGDTCTFT